MPPTASEIVSCSSSEKVALVGCKHAKVFKTPFFSVPFLRSRHIHGSTRKKCSLARSDFSQLVFACVHTDFGTRDPRGTGGKNTIQHPRVRRVFEIFFAHATAPPPRTIGRTDGSRREFTAQPQPSVSVRSAAGRAPQQHEICCFAV